MKKIRIKDTTNEMSTTGTGASFTSGKGAQYASPKAFKIVRKSKEEGINSPFDTPSPSIPNRPSKAIDYKKLFQEKKKYNPITDPTSASDDAGFNDGIDMDSLDAAAVLEMSKTASPEAAAKELKRKPGEGFKVGQVMYSDDGTRKSTITKINPETGAVSWRIDQLPGYDKMFDELDDVTATARRTAQKSQDDQKFKEFYEEIRLIRNKVRTHLRKEHPEIYSRIQMRSESVNEAIDLVHVYDKDGKIFGTGEIEQELPNDKVKVRFDGNYVGTFRADRVKPVMEVTIGGSSRERLTNLAQNIGREEFAMNVLEIPDENVLDMLVDELAKLYDMRSVNEPINEARYSQFKKQTEVTTPTQQIHRAVREIRRKIDEITKVVGHTERMKMELKSSNEGMSYLKRTKNAISKISEKIQELNNRIKGLTE